ncbi:hypothetical protein CVS37_28170 [Burkholderia lata]|nr:hypothetical protein CVS37_28170 [Burkholderia lata]
MYRAAHRTPHTAHRTPHTAHRTPHTAHRTPQTVSAVPLKRASRQRREQPARRFDHPFGQ